MGGLVLHLLHQTPLETPKSSALLWLQLEHSSRHTSPCFLYLQLLIACNFDFSLHLSKTSCIELVLLKLMADF